jgi:hypothetical protein
MKRIHLMFIHFTDIWAINYTTLKIYNLPRSGTRKNRISIPLNHGLVTDETDTSTFYTITRYSGHK